MPANKKYVSTKRSAPGKFYKGPEERAAVRAARVAEQEAIQAEKEAAAAAIIAAEEAAQQAIIDKAAAVQVAQVQAKAKIAADKKAEEERIVAEEEAAQRAEKRILLKARAEAAAARRAAEKAARREYSKTPRGKLEIQISRMVGVDLVQEKLIFNEGFIGPSFYLPGKEEIQIPEERPTEIDIAHLV